MAESAPFDAPVLAYVGLGGNVGESETTLRAALRRLDTLPDTRLVGASRLYRTPAWGRRDQPDFINAAAALETRLSPRALLETLLAVEQEFGRRRSCDDRWGPRTLDLDILLYGDRRIDEPGLHVPHPFLHERAFALAPLLDLSPDLEIPGRGRVRDALAGVADEGIEAIG